MWPRDLKVRGPFRRRRTASYCRLLANPDLGDEILFHGWLVVLVVAQQVVVLSLESAEEGSVNFWRGWWAVPLYV